MPATVADILIDTLYEIGVRQIFGVVGDALNPLTDAIRREERERRLPQVPIIAVTANAQAGEGDRCLARGMTAYLSKPVRMADLRRVIDGTPPPQQPSARLS